jgi:hypothetical protein
VVPDEITLKQPTCELTFSRMRIEDDSMCTTLTIILLADGELVDVRQQELWLRPVAGETVATFFQSLAAEVERTLPQLPIADLYPDDLIARVRPSAFGDDTSKASYHEHCKLIWKRDVPSRGASSTVQGELLRATEKLRDEAHRNGNENWSEDFESLLTFLETQFHEYRELLGELQHATLRGYVDRLRDAENPDTSDEPYDYVCQLIGTLHEAYPEPIARTLATGFED